MILVLLACAEPEPVPRERPVAFHEITLGEAVGRPVEPIGPSDWRPSEEPLPLLILLHGYGATPEAQDLLLRFSKQVDSERFVLLIPQGTANEEGTYFWNATDACCGWDSGVDDVGYLLSLVDEAEAAWGAGLSSVFITGHSNGGYMSYRMACEAPDRIDGIAPLAGAPWKDPEDCAVGDPVPVLHIHGDGDESVLYEGSGSTPGALESVERWADRAGCTGSEQGTPLDLVDGVPGLETERLDYTGCTHPVSLWTMVGVGHVPLVNDAYLQQVLSWLNDSGAH